MGRCSDERVRHVFRSKSKVDLESIPCVVGGHQGRRQIQTSAIGVCGGGAGDDSGKSGGTSPSIVDSDRDGVSMALLDYKRYHGLAIIELDFKRRTYTYLDPLRGTEQKLIGNLQTLLEGISDGEYAINYIEIPESGGAK